MISLLVVEDDELLLKSMTAFLTKHGFEAHGALSAAKAYEEMERKNFDLIISDIMMDGEDGFEFATAVRQMDREKPIIFVTARSDIESKLLRDLISKKIAPNFAGVKQRDGIIFFVLFLILYSHFCSIPITL